MEKEAVVHPICLRDMGAFHIGGRQVQLSAQPSFERVLSDGGEPVKINLNGTYAIEQMYVQYFLPQESNGKGPLVFWHGGGMTGAVWETTPDGRPGWVNYFVRQGWDVYVCDAVERGRSGFASYPDIWPDKPITQTIDDVYVRFRIGDQPDSYNIDPALRTAYSNSRFPLSAFDLLAKQMVPRWTHTNEAMLDAFEALLERLGTATVLCHSQSGPLALKLASQCPGQVSALIAIEPAGIPDFGVTPFQTRTLIVLGDNLDLDSRWVLLKRKITRFANACEQVKVLSLPDLGVYGNSHVMMMDDNSQDIARRIQAWLQAV